MQLNTVGVCQVAPFDIENTYADRCTDEISALVIDPGYSTVRAGFAGEDTPKSVVSSYYGTLPAESESTGKRKLYGDNAIHTPLPHLSINNFMSREGIVDDWDTAADVWEYAITSKLTSTKQRRLAANGLNDIDNEDVRMESVEDKEQPLGENALLMTEPGWNPAKNREKALEISMESWGVPAFFLARNGVLAAYVQVFLSLDQRADCVLASLQERHQPWSSTSAPRAFP